MREEKKELIKNYLLDEKISEEERKERFEIAWDIEENFERIKFELRQKLIKELKQKIEQSEGFRDYIIINRGLIEGEKYGTLFIFKKNWLLSPESKNIGILNYAFEAEISGISDLCIGIVKQDNDNKIPFKGNWQKQDDIEHELLNNINQIYNALGGSPKGWKVSEWWIAWKYLHSFYRGMWQREFFLQIITERGFKQALDYLFSELVELKKLTEKFIDNFVETYKHS